MVELNRFVQTFQPANALMAKEKFEQGRAQENRLVAQEKRSAEAFESGKEDRVTAAQTRKLTQTATALNSALRAQTPQMQESIYNSLKPDGEDTPTFKFEGGKTTIQYPNGEEISGPMAVVIEFTEQVKNDPTWMTDPKKAEHTVAWGASKGLTIKLGKDTSSGKGTEDERQAALRNMTVPEYKRMLKEKLQMGMSDYDERAYEKQDDRVYKTENEIRKLKSELSGVPAPKEGEDDFFKPKRDLLQEYEKLLTRHEKKRQAILDKYKKGGKDKGIKVPQATIDYWKSKGKTMEQIEDAFYKKYKDNPPKIGF